MHESTQAKAAAAGPPGRFLIASGDRARREHTPAPHHPETPPRPARHTTHQTPALSPREGPASGEAGFAS
jgi:hypothetical protein